MDRIEDAIATLGIPGSIAAGLLIGFALLQLIGELLEFFGVIVPTVFKLRKIVTRRKEKEKQAQAEAAKTMSDVRTLLTEVNAHYSEDNIKQRDSWMTWVNDRAVVYDNTIVELTETLAKITDALDNNTKMTEKMFIETSRDRIIDFASKVTCKPLCPVTREEFNRIFKVYTAYEAFLKERNLTNGEVEINYQLIEAAYKERVATHNFVEDHRDDLK